MAPINTSRSSDFNSNSIFCVSDKEELDLGQNRKHEHRLFPWKGGAQGGEVVEVDAHAQRGLHGGAGEDGGGVAGGDVEEAAAVLISLSSRRLENTFSASRRMNESVNCKCLVTACFYVGP